MRAATYETATLLVNGKPFGDVIGQRITIDREPKAHRGYLSTGPVIASITMTMDRRGFRTLLGLVGERRGPGASMGTLLRRAGYNNRKGRSARRRLA